MAGEGAGGARRPQGWLRWARIASALVFLGGLAWAFLNLSNGVPPALTGALSWPQFVPSLLRWTCGPAVAAGGFLAVLAATVLFGRVYCSAVCPLGVLQDGFIRLSRRLGWSQRHRHAQRVSWAPYAVLLVALAAFLSGGGWLLGFLDPFSVFGRVVADVFRPVVVSANNLLAGMFERFGIYSIYRVDLRGVSAGAVCFALGLLVLPLAMSLFRGRLYCNAICPVGTLLGLVSRFSVFRVRIDRGACVKCADCAAVCKAECIDLRRGVVDASRCVACFNCLSACRDAGIRYGLWRKTAAAPAGPAAPDAHGRREFMGAALVLAAGGSCVGSPARGADEGAASEAVKAAAQKPSRVPEAKRAAVSPPGSLSIARFNRLCTGCRLCVAACPSHVLKPALREYGLAGFLQPHMDFRSSFCEYECLRCGEVCPTGAIRPLSKEAKRAAQMGRVVFLKDNCVVHSAKTACGSCAEHCPTQAVHMVPFEKNLTSPEIDPDRCVGCGACEHVCPTRPYRAIFVDGNPEHRTALPPKIEKPAPVAPAKKDAAFPF